MPFKEQLNDLGMFGVVKKKMYNTNVSNIWRTDLRKADLISYIQLQKQSGINNLKFMVSDPFNKIL